MPLAANDIMSRNLVVAHPEMTSDEIMDLLVANKISGVPVTNAEGALIGVISMYDILSSGVNITYSAGYFEDVNLDRILAKEGFHLELVTDGFVSDYMSWNVYSVTPETPIDELARLMYSHGIHRLIVVNPKTHMPIGIVTTFDLLKVMSDRSLLKKYLTSDASCTMKYRVS